MDDNHGLDFDDMSSLFPCEINNAIQYINLGYVAQAPKIMIKNVLKRRRECGTYLATALRHRRRLKMMKKRDE